MITCLLSTYNEAARLPAFLKHATQWADEVLICDKESTDDTIAIASMAWRQRVRIQSVPYSPQGHEDTLLNVTLCTHDWVFLMTPGEVPTPELIRNVKAKISMCGEHVAVFGIPKKLYSFGIHDTRSPWSIGCQPMLFHRQRAIVSNQVHANISGGRFHPIPYSETCHVLHPTHATVPDFLRSHMDYILAEAASNPDELFARASNMLQTGFAGNPPELFGQQCAWKMYWLGCCLAAWAKKQNRDVPEEYRALTEKALEDWT